MTEQAFGEYGNGYSAVNILVGKGHIEAALTKWVVGERVNGDHRGGRFLKRLDPPPPEVWEIRVTDPSVQARLIGRFAEPDTLILTGLRTREALRNKTSHAWADEMAACVSAWNRLFANSPPFHANHIHDYVTENCDAFPI